ncbi:hypothetical protein TSAR_004278 [Trichomalopsis sarcophagae]|uniref:Uncharacterized protein n=1 Tax=Trichomalopsis sarcophagae TaxID=543379 RepID=A0A232FED2_9HYME|nr:hypothetical protein TSAR_004278 [Trichomalopsis sarcophagae]
MLQMTMTKRGSSCEWGIIGQGLSLRFCHPTLACNRSAVANVPLSASAILHISSANLPNAVTSCIVPLHFKISDIIAEYKLFNLKCSSAHIPL